jgi:hypothetical protein
MIGFEKYSISINSLKDNNSNSNINNNNCSNNSNIDKNIQHNSDNPSTYLPKS